MKLDLVELRRKAELATPGPWKVAKGKSFGVQSENKNIASCFRSQNEDFIATANPQTVIALLDHIDKLTEIVDAAIANNKSYLIPTNQEWAAEIKEEMRQNYITLNRLLREYMKEMGINED